MLVPASKKSMYVSHILVMVATIVVAAIAGVFLYPLSHLAVYAIIGCAAAFSIFLMVRPILYYRFYKYAITDDRIDIRHGVIIRNHVVVPIERLHQVEVVRGPINGIFGLANVNVTTAGGVAKIKFLENKVAESIVDGLNDVINRIVRDRNSDA